MNTNIPFSDEGLLVGCTYRSKKNTHNIYVASNSKTLVYRNYTLKSTRDYFVENFFISDCSVREITENWQISVTDFDKLVYHFMKIEDLRKKAIKRYEDLKTPCRHKPELLWFNKVKHRYTRGH